MSRIRPLPDSGMLNRILEYIPDSGHLYWRHRPEDMFPDPKRAASWNARFSGARAFTCKTATGVYGSLFGRKFGAHRVIWKMVKGEDPFYIDHIDGNPHNNRIFNLRDTTPSGNMRNRVIGSNNSSGHIGVSRHNGSSWRATIGHCGETIILGSFRDFEDAVAARQAAETEYGYHLNHGRAPK